MQPSGGWGVAGRGTQPQAADKAGYAQMPAWACTRPEAAASASAAWSRPVWPA